MISYFRPVIITALVVTAGVLFLWQATGGNYYTKFEIVEEVELKLDPSDPLAAAGFYGEGPVTKTISRKEFRLGLLPVPQRLFDKHAISVVTLVFPVWVLGAAYLWLTHRRRGRVNQ